MCETRMQTSGEIVKYWDGVYIAMVMATAKVRLALAERTYFLYKEELRSHRCSDCIGHGYQGIIQKHH